MVGEKTVRKERKGGGRFALGFIAASALWVILLVLVMRYWRTPGHAAPAARQTMTARPSPLVDEAPGRRRSVAALVAQRFASLHVPVRKAILPSDLALQANLAIKRGDFATANRIASTVLARSKLTGWRFYPFDAFMDTVVGAGNDPQLAWELHEWQRSDPDSALAYLISAQYFETTGWAVRGEYDASEVPPRDLTLFVEDLAEAASDARRSIALNPRIPWSYLQLLRTVSGQGDSGEVETVFKQAIGAYPAYYGPYGQRLYMLTPKWGGSVQAMYAFVDRYAGGAPAGSPLKLLYLQLYGYLANAAWIDCNDDDDGCMEAQMSRTVTRRMGTDLLQALRLYEVSSPTAYSHALWPILGALVKLPKSNEWSGLGAVLQMAAHVMKSDDQLMHRPGHNNYVLDDITARVWEQLGNRTNARRKFSEALSDIQHTAFPDEARKDEAMATVYDHMTSLADSSRRYVDVIAYQEAANAVGGRNHGDIPYETCYAYYRLKLPEQAVKACTRLIDGDDNYLQARYWRAKSYEQMHDWPAALADFAPVADSADNWFRVAAAIDMSVIYGNMHDFAGQLRSMNQHRYLFNPAWQSRSDLAVAFNNRCYAYMELGHLHKALADCTRSLQYGHIPDAYEKQLTLMARLGIKAPH